MRKKELMPFVIVYRDLDLNIDDILSRVKMLENVDKDILKWSEWQDFGKTCNFHKLHPPRVNSDHDEVDSLSKILFDLVYEYYKMYIKQYANIKFPTIKSSNFNTSDNITDISAGIVTTWDIDKNAESDNILKKEYDCWDLNSLDIIKYNNNYDKKYILNYHLDGENKKGNEGPHGILTSTLYLNDDYEGGEFSFLSEFSNTIIKYKPRAGDLVIFPASKPFFHAAHPAVGNNKYFARHFLTWYSSGNKEWKDGESKFGKDGWRFIQQEISKAKETLGVFNKDVFFPGEDLGKRTPTHGIPFFAEEIIEVSNDW